MRRKSPVLLAAVVLAVSPVLSACGDDAKNASTTAQPSASSSATSGSPSQNPSGNPSQSPVQQDAESQAFLKKMKSGLGDDGTVHVDLKLGGGGETTAKGDLAYGKDGNKARLDVSLASAGNGKIALLLLGEDSYLSMPPLTKEGTYFKVPVGSQMLASFTGGASGLDPRSSFAGFEAGLKSTENLGAETIGGDRTTHYRLDVDAAKTLQAMGPGLGQQGLEGLPDTMTYDVWLDEEDRVRRISYAVDGGNLQLDMTEWGEPVTIEAPDEAHLVKAPAGF